MYQAVAHYVGSFEYTVVCMKGNLHAVRHRPEVGQGSIQLTVFVISSVDHNFPECRKQKTIELPRRPILHYAKH